MKIHFYTEVVILGNKEFLKPVIILWRKISDTFQYCSSSSLPCITHVSASGAQITFRKWLLLLGLKNSKQKREAQKGCVAT